MVVKNVERFFLNTLLRICIAGLVLVLASNLILYPEDTLSIAISGIILFTCTVSYFFRSRYPTPVVLIITSVALLTMSYQRLTTPQATTTLSVILIVGFIFSVMLKRKILWIMHGIAFTILNTIFILQLDDAVTAAITYSTLYFILTYATWVLKSNYDGINQYLRETNIQLNEKSKEIEAQNEELLQIQANLSMLNSDMEKVINERTQRIQIQNKVLLNYSYTNAHHLRGPVARLLGLASIYKLEVNPDVDFLLPKWKVRRLRLIR